MRKVPLHQEHRNINTVGADAPGGPAEKSSKHVFAPGKFVQQYVFAGDCLIDFGQGAEGVGPYIVY